CRTSAPWLIKLTGRARALSAIRTGARRHPAEGWDPWTRSEARHPSLQVSPLVDERPIYCFFRRSITPANADNIIRSSSVDPCVRRDDPLAGYGLRPGSMTPATVGNVIFASSMGPSLRRDDAPLNRTAARTHPLIPLLQHPHPDIPEADRCTLVAVRLQQNRCRSVRLVLRIARVLGHALERNVILHQHAIMKRSYISRCGERAIAPERRRRPHHVVRLPLTGLSRRVHKRRVLLVDARSLSVDVRLVVVRVHDLQLVSANRRDSQEHPAVAAILTGPRDPNGNAPFDVQLIVPETPPGLYVTRRLVHGDDTVRNYPLRRRAV